MQPVVERRRFDKGIIRQQAAVLHVDVPTLSIKDLNAHLGGVVELEYKG